MSQNENLPLFTSERPCPRCKELLHWSQHEAPPKVDDNTHTGFVHFVELMRFCISCGSREGDFVNSDKQPVWTPIESEREEHELL
jgi:hypothetical protein